MLAPADAPRSEKRAFGRPSVKRRAGLSSSSVVGLIAVSIRAIFYVGAAPRGLARCREHSGRLWLPWHFPEQLGAGGRGSLEPLLGANAARTATVLFHPCTVELENPIQDRVEIKASSSP